MRRTRAACVAAFGCLDRALSPGLPLKLALDIHALHPRTPLTVHIPVFRPPPSSRISAVPRNRLRHPHVLTNPILDTIAWVSYGVGIRRRCIERLWIHGNLTGVLIQPLALRHGTSSSAGWRLQTTRFAVLLLVSLRLIASSIQYSTPTPRSNVTYEEKPLVPGQHCKAPFGWRVEVRKGGLVRVSAHRRRSWKSEGPRGITM